MFRAQEQGLDKLPPHLKGEVLGGLADTEHRLGNTEQARTYLRRIVESMPDSPYERRARQWLEQPERISRDNRMMCLSCHDAGRLKYRIAGGPSGP